MKWISLKKEKPKLGQKVLIYREGKRPDKIKWSSIDLAYYDINPYDKRERAFIDYKSYEADMIHKWIHDNTVYWQAIEPPKKSNINK